MSNQRSDEGQQRYVSAGVRAVTILLALATQPAFAGSPDTDADGVNDAFDNCTLIANPDQRDTDADGFGNRCDPDFNNDQIVNVEDLGTLKLAFFTTAAHTDLNGDGITNVVDLGILKNYFFLPPGPGMPDPDDDGIPRHQDRCDESPPGALSLTEGCSAFDLAEDPDKVMVRVNSLTADLLAQLVDNPDIAHLQDSAVSAQGEIDSAVETIRRGNMCAGSDAMNSGLVSLAQVHSQLMDTIGAFEEELSITRPFTDEDCRQADAPPECEAGADHSDIDAAVMSFWLAEATLSDLQMAAQESVGLFETACGLATAGASVQGTITTMEPDRGRFFLDDGSYIGIVDGADMPPDIYPGREVFVGGTQYGSAILAEGISTVGLQSNLADFLTYQTCAKLRFAPFQRFEPISNGPYTLHEPAGYRYESGKYRLEHGMRLAVDNIPFCGDSFGPFSVRYSLHLTLEFVNRNTNLTETQVLATELDDADQPLPLPSLIKPGTDATLYVSHQRQSCEVVNLDGSNRAPGTSFFVCSEQEEYTTEQLTLRVYDKGAYCNALYERTSFSLEEVSPTTFEPTYVNHKQTVLVVPDPGTSMTVVGEGYEVYGPSSSSYPALKRIDEGEQFAVFEHDCASQNLLYVAGTCGTTSASGLQWPHLEGERNNKPFSYTCRLPQVVRDLVDECPSPPDSYYKLPFNGGYPVWLMSQGNNGTFTHNGNQAYAFDFDADTGTTVRAARGGSVSFVREDQTGNSYYAPGCSNCMANAVNILHQDGTMSQYFHFRTNGVFVSQGQKVQRGDVIGEVGNTGYSTGSHLHFHARFPASATHPVRFRSLDNGMMTPPSACYIPVRNDILSSDNN